MAQSSMAQFGLESGLAKVFRDGGDPHRMVAALACGKAEGRRRAKAINFGKPGGMGAAKLCGYARDAYGVDLDVADVARFSDAVATVIPEMVPFLGG